MCYSQNEQLFTDQYCEMTKKQSDLSCPKLSSYAPVGNSKESNLWANNVTARLNDIRNYRICYIYFPFSLILTRETRPGFLDS